MARFLYSKQAHLFWGRATIIIAQQQQTLFIMSDGSIDLLANDEQPPYLADNGLRLDSDETYRLFVSLQEEFKQQRERATCNTIFGER